MNTVFKPKYFKDPGGPLPPWFWALLIVVAILLWWMHGCQGGVVT